MRTARRMAVLLLALIVAAGCTSTAPRDTVMQVSTIDALLAGVYDGHLACGELRRYGDTGLGTFDKLDGEMAMIDGVVYQVKADGKVYRPSPDVSTPFAAVANFRADQTIPIDRPMSMAGLQQEIDKRCPNKNVFYVIQVWGTFSHMKTRSVPAQKKPYPPLVQVVRHQSVFEMENVSGRVVGFRCPPYVKGVNVPGYHLHFISDDLTQGGHILDFTVTQGRAEIDVCNRFFMLLPGDSASLGRADLAKDRAADLEKVERQGSAHSKPTR